MGEEYEKWVHDTEGLQFNQPWVEDAFEAGRSSKPAASPGRGPEHGCGGTQEACCIPGCPECKQPADASVDNLDADSAALVAYRCFAGWDALHVELAASKADALQKRDIALRTQTRLDEARDELAEANKDLASTVEKLELYRAELARLKSVPECVERFRRQHDEHLRHFKGYRGHLPRVSQHGAMSADEMNTANQCLEWILSLTGTFGASTETGDAES